MVKADWRKGRERGDEDREEGGDGRGGADEDEEKGDEVGDEDEEKGDEVVMKETRMRRNAMRWCGRRRG